MESFDIRKEIEWINIRYDENKKSAPKIVQHTLQEIILNKKL
jgi:type III secretion system FlhB-like substrate exporter